MRARTLSRTLFSIAGGTAAVLATYRFALRPWHLRWGATDEEVNRAMPGDEEIARPTLQCTRAITIHARPEEIWPWLVQIGKGRAGFYSYDWIENLMGLDIHSTSRILPEYQQLNVGDVIPGLGPVTALARHQYWLLAGHEAWGDITWVMALYPVDEHLTRLISRERYRLRWRTLFRLLPPRYVPFYLFFEPGEFIMLRKMLLGIRQRAETGRGMKERAANTAGVTPSAMVW